VSGRAMEWALEVARDKQLDATTRFVLVALAYHANSRTGKAWAGRDTLAADTGLSVRAVQRALAVLERRTDPDTGEVGGYLEATRRYGYTTVWHFPQCPQPATRGRLSDSPRGDSQAQGGDSQSSSPRSGGDCESPDPGVSRREPAGTYAREAVDTWTDERGYVYVGPRP
jgi:hypothetical protein